MHRFLKIFCVIAILPLAAWGIDNALPAPGDQAAVVRGNTLFATALYAKLQSQTGNLFLSPASISTALAMTYGGARGDTANEMANTLHFTLNPERLHPATAKLLADLNAEGKAHGYQLSVANALWFQKGFLFQNDFIKLVRDNYKATLSDVDFADKEAACKTINNWVDQQTVHKIPTLITPDDVSQLTRLVLTNAVYFKGDWLTPFDKKETRDGDFHTTKEHAVAAKLMYRSGEFNYLDGGMFQAVEIPYIHKDLSLIVFLPRAVDGLGTFEQSITAAQMETWLASFRPTSEVQLTLPRFRLNAQFELADTLKAMGMKLAFDKYSADFSGMTGRRELVISKVIHKAYLDVNEEGTEAAAATAVVMPQYAAAMMQPPPPVIFRADHPFMFLIRDNHSGSILFWGRMSDPSQ